MTIEQIQALTPAQLAELFAQIEFLLEIAGVENMHEDDIATAESLGALGYTF